MKRPAVIRVSIPCHPSVHTGGFTLMEVIVSAGIIGVLFLVTVPLLAHVRLVRQEADRRIIAQQEAANIMEQIALLAKQNGLTSENANELSLSRAADTLPDANLKIAIDPGNGPLSGRQVTVNIQWTTDMGDAAIPASLTAWFPQSEDRN